MNRSRRSRVPTPSTSPAGSSFPRPQAQRAITQANGEGLSGMQEPEPSVLDYVKSLLPWSRQHIIIPRLGEALTVSAEPEAVAEQAAAVPWRSLLALSSALLAQILLEPPQPAAPPAVAFYLIAAGLLLWSALRGEWTLASHRDDAVAVTDPLTVRWLPFLLSSILLVPAFILLGGSKISPGIALPPMLSDALGLHENLFTW